MEQDSGKGEESERMDIDEKKTDFEPAEVEQKSEEEEIEERIDLIISRVKDSDDGVQSLAIGALTSELTGISTSITGVPKSLKAIRRHYTELKEFLGTLKDSNDNKRCLADILSVISMAEETKTRESLELKLIGTTTKESLEEWGFDYARFLAGEVANEFAEKFEVSSGMQLDEAGEKSVLRMKIQGLIDVLAPYLMTHSSEPTVCDMLLKTGQLGTVRSLLDKKNYEKVTLYLMQCSRFLEGSDGDDVLVIVRDIFLDFEDFTSAMSISIKLTDVELMKEVFEKCTDPLSKKQLALMIARQQLVFEVEDEDIMEIMSNAFLSQKFKEVAKALFIEDPKSPEDIFHPPGEDKKAKPGHLDSAKANLVKTFVNAFANAGFGTDTLVVENGPEWVFKNRGYAQMAAVASLGIIQMWDIDAGISEIDKYLYIQNMEKEYVISGALLAIGIINSCVRSDFDPALNILSEYIEPGSSGQIEQIGALVGMGLAFAGTGREDVAELILPVLKNSDAPIQARVLAAHSIGLVFSGSGRHDIAEELMTVLESLAPTEVTQCEIFILFPLGLSYIFLSKKEEGVLMHERLGRLQKQKYKDHKGMHYLIEIFEASSFAGNGHVLSLQRFLNMCSDHTEEDEVQPIAVIALAMVALGEEIGEEMIMRFFDRLLQYSKVNIRRAVPLAIGLTSVSNPEIRVLEALSKLSHDADEIVAANAIFAIGIIGSGTNNSRIIAALQKLALFYKDKPFLLFMVKFSQGLLHLGKGTLSLDPLHSHRELINPRALSSLVSLIFVVLQLGEKMISKYPYLFFLTAPAMYPKVLATVDENMELASCTVRVGNLVDIVGQPGHPKRITGFQTNDTPVVVNRGECAEMADEKFSALSSILEGFVIIQPKEKEPEDDGDD